MKSSSLADLTKQFKVEGIQIPARVYRDAIVHDFYLMDKYRELLYVYALRQVTSEKFLSCIVDGQINIRSLQYSVIWISSPSKCRKEPMLLTSMRYCDMLNRGYILVKTFEDGKNSSLIEELKL